MNTLRCCATFLLLTNIYFSYTHTYTLVFQCGQILLIKKPFVGRGTFAGLGREKKAVIGTESLWKDSISASVPVIGEVIQLRLQALCNKPWRQKKRDKPFGRMTPTRRTIVDECCHQSGPIWCLPEVFLIFEAFCTHFEEQPTHAETWSHAPHTLC